MTYQNMTILERLDALERCILELQKKRDGEKEQYDRQSKHFQAQLDAIVQAIGTNDEGENT